MRRRCPQCGADNLSPAHFCAHCGTALDSSPGTVGRAPHPDPLSPPPTSRRVAGAADLHFRIESAWGGSRLLGTENLGLLLLNGGYPLCGVVLKVEGLDPAGNALFAVEHELKHLPRGEEVRIEIPSYEISEPAQEWRVTLVTAEYAS